MIDEFTSSTPVLVIVNPHAGRDRAGQNWPTVAEALQSAGVAFDVVTTRKPGEAITLAEHAASEYRMVVAAGGTGTVHEVANGLLLAAAGAPTTPMAIIPLGLDNDFAKNSPAEVVLDPAESWRDAVAKITRGETGVRDAARVTTDIPHHTLQDRPLHIINALTIGLGALALDLRQQAPRYYADNTVALTSMVSALGKYTPPLVITRLDAVDISQYCTMIAVMLGRCMGGRFWVAPEAKPDDGLLDVLLVPEMGRLGLLGLLTEMMKGSVSAAPQLRRQTTRRVRILSNEALLVETDGEVPFRNAHRLEIEILPNALTVVV